MERVILAIVVNVRLHHTMLYRRRKVVERSSMMSYGRRAVSRGRHRRPGNTVTVHGVG